MTNTERVRGGVGGGVRGKVRRTFHAIFTNWFCRTLKTPAHINRKGSIVLTTFRVCMTHKWLDRRSFNCEAIRKLEQEQQRRRRAANENLTQ